MIEFTLKKSDKCAEVLLSHEVQISLSCSAKWMFHPQGQTLKRKNDYMVSIYFYSGVNEVAVRIICAGVHRDTKARYLRQMRRAILTCLQ